LFNFKIAENAKKKNEKAHPPSSPSTSSSSSSEDEEETGNIQDIVEVPKKVLFKLEVSVNTVQFLEKMMLHQNQGSSSTTIPILVTGEAILSAVKKEEGGGSKQKNGSNSKRKSRIRGKKVEKKKKPQKVSKKFYKVERILEKKVFGNGRVQYLVRWQGFSE
jgi:hypothetical protein